MGVGRHAQPHGVTKMAGRCFFFCSFALVAITGLAGCSGNPGILPPALQPTPTSVIFVEAPPSSLAVNAKATVYAVTEFSTPAGTNENTEVTYAVSCGSANACGTLTTSDELGAMVYTAPAAIPSGAAVTLTATSAVNPSLSRSATITIVPPIPITVTLGTPPASLAVSAQLQLGATIANDVSANPQVTWTVNCGGTACGSFSPTTTGSEAPTTYTAPAAVPSGNGVTVTATSVTDPTKSASATIAITPQAPMLANGTYVFQVSGLLSTGANYVTGVLTAQNGAVTGGEQDSIFPGGDGYSEYSQQQVILGGSYATTPDGNLAITVNLGPDDTETLEGTLTSNQKGFVGGIDGTFANGTLEPQTSTAAPLGGYAFSLDAADIDDGSPWIDGVLNVDSPGGISGNGSVLDINEEGSYYAGPISLTASTVSAPDAYGRVMFQVNLAQSSAGWPMGTVWSDGPLYFAGYVVDATHLRLVEVGSAQNSYVVSATAGGIAVSQGANTGQFSAAQVAGTSYVFGAEGEDGRGVLQVAGVLTLNADGTATGTLNWNDQGGNAPQAPIPCSGTYTVDPTGRVSVSNLTDGSTFTYTLHLYLSGGGSALVLSDDDNDAFAGEGFQRQAGTIPAASFSGSYGLNASLYAQALGYAPNAAEAVGPMTVTPGSGADNVSGYADLGVGYPDFAVSGSFTAAANGIFTGTLSGLGSTTASASNPFTLYLIDSTQGIAMETSGPELTLARVASSQ